MPYSSGLNGAPPLEQSAPGLRVGAPALRVISPPVVSNYPAFMPTGVAARTRTELLLPLSDCERMLVVAIHDVISGMEKSEHEYGRREVLPLLVAFEAATGVSYHDAPWGDA